MEYPNPKIKYYRIRTFNEKMSVSFEFLRENWKQMLKLSFYLILPLCLFQSFAMNSFMRVYFSFISMEVGGMNSNVYSFITNFVVFMLFALLGSAMLNALIFTMMNEYERRDDRLMTIKIGEIRKPLLRNIGKLLLIYLLQVGILMGVALIFGLLFAISSKAVIALLVLILILVLIAAILFFMVPMNLFMPIYIFEEIPFFQAFRKSFNYGLSHLGETFLVMLVFGLIANVVSSVAVTPWMVVMMIGQIFSLAEPGSGMQTSILYQFAIYILGILQSYGTYASMIIVAIAIAFQYFHIREKKEGITVSSDIQNFERL